MLTIRRARETDMNEVRLLIEALEKPQRFPFEPFNKKYKQCLADPSMTCIVAEDAVAVVAFGSLRITNPLHHPGPVAEVVELVVDEMSRGGGIGARIVGEMLSIAREAGCCVIELASNSSRQRAHRFYMRLGFAITHMKLTMNLNKGDIE